MRDSKGRFCKATEEEVFAVGYKGFDENMKCRDKQYSENTIFTENKAELCNCGMHFCENPLSVFTYYQPKDNNQYAIVESLALAKREKDKSCTTKLRVKSKISIKDMIKLGIDFIFEKNKNNPSATSGNYSTSATSGNYSTSATSGNYSTSATSGNSSTSATSGNYSTSATSGNYSTSATSGYYGTSATSGDSSTSATSGDYSTSATSGYYGTSATSGNSSTSATSGDYSTSATSGDHSTSATSGDYSTSATSGDRSTSATSGYYGTSATSGNSSTSATSGNSSTSIVNGKNSIAVANGVNSKAKGKIGNWICLTEYCNGNIKHVNVARIDGIEIKEDTLYTLKNGKFIEYK